MHRRTKKLLLGTAGLVVTLVPGVLATSQPGVLSGFSTIAGAEEVSNFAFTGAYWSQGKELNSYAFTSDFAFEVNVTQSVTDGDHLTLTSEGVSLDSLDGQSLKTKDGVEIGKIQVTKRYQVKKSDGRVLDFSKNDTLSVTDLNNIPADLQDLTPGDVFGYEAKVVFNKEGEARSSKGDLKFSIQAKELRSLFPLSQKAANYPVKMFLNKEKLFERAVKQPADKIVKTQERASVWSTGGEVFVRDGSLKGLVQFNLVSSREQGFKAGDRIRVTLGSNSKALFDTKARPEGSKITFSHGRISRDTVTKVLPSGIVVNQKNPATFKIVSSKPNEMIFELETNNYKEDILFTIPVQLITTDGLDQPNYSFGNAAIYTDRVKDEKNDLKGPIEKEFRPAIRSLTGSASGTKVVTKTTRWIDEENKSDIKTPNIGEAFEPAGTVRGYTFVRSEASKDGAVTTHLFKKDAEKPEDEEIVTSFLEEGSGEKLKDPVKAEKEAEPGTIDGYQFIRTERKGNQVTHWFKKKEEPKKPETKQPNTRYVDEDGKVIEEVPGSQDKKEISGYTYLRTEKDKDGNTVHVYHKIVTRFVTDKGMTLKQMDGAQPKEEIDGYEFVETKTDEKTSDVTHVYREVVPTTEPLTILKDDKGNVLKTTKGTHDPEDLPGYKFLRTEKDKDGNTVHVYHRIVTNFVTTKDGKEVVLKAKDGAQPKEEIEGYEFLETKTDEKTGDTKHFYKVKVVAGVEKKAPVQTGGSAGMMLLPAAAVLGLGGLVAGLARRKNN